MQHSQRTVRYVAPLFRTTPVAQRLRNSRTSRALVVGVFILVQPHAIGLPRLAVRFYHTGHGREPVRDWLKALPAAERRTIGDEIRTLQFGWPVGMPLVRKLQPDLWEVRVRLEDRIARVLTVSSRG